MCFKLITIWYQCKYKSIYVVHLWMKIENYVKKKKVQSKYLVKIII